MTSTSGTAGDEWRSVRVEQSTLRRFALALSPSPESIWLLCEFWAAAAAATEAEANGVDDDLGRAPLSWLSDEEDEVRRCRSGGRGNRGCGGLDSEGAAPSSASVKVKSAAAHGTRGRHPKMALEIEEGTRTKDCTSSNTSTSLASSGHFCFLKHEETSLCKCHKLMSPSTRVWAEKGPCVLGLCRQGASTRSGGRLAR